VIYGRPKTSLRYRVVPTPQEENRRKAASEFPEILVNTVISLTSDMWIIRENEEIAYYGRHIFFFSPSLIISSWNFTANLDQSVFDSTEQ